MKSNVLVAVVLTCILSASIPLIVNAEEEKASEPTSWQQEKEAADKSITGEVKNYIKAANHLRKALLLAKENKINPEERITLAYRLSVCGKRLQSIDIYYEGLSEKLSAAIDSENDQLIEDTLIDVANIEFTLKKYEKAAEHINCVIPRVKKTRGENFAGLIRAYQLLGCCYAQMQQFDKAKESFTKAIDISNNTTSNAYLGSLGLAHAYLGLIAEKSNQTEEARKQYALAKNKIDLMSKLDKDKLSGIDREFLKFAIEQSYERSKSLKQE